MTSQFTLFHNTVVTLTNLDNKTSIGEPQNKLRRDLLNIYHHTHAKNLHYYILSEQYGFDLVAINSELVAVIVTKGPDWNREVETNLNILFHNNSYTKSFIGGIWYCTFKTGYTDIEEYLKRALPEDRLGLKRKLESSGYADLEARLQRLHEDNIVGLEPRMVSTQKESPVEQDTSIAVTMNENDYRHYVFCENFSEVMTLIAKHPETQQMHFYHLPVSYGYDLIKVSPTRVVVWYNSKLNSLRENFYEATQQLPFGLESLLGIDLTQDVLYRRSIFGEGVVCYTFASAIAAKSLFFTTDQLNPVTIMTISRQDVNTLQEQNTMSQSNEQQPESIQLPGEERNVGLKQLNIIHQCLFIAKAELEYLVIDLRNNVAEDDAHVYQAIAEYIASFPCTFRVTQNMPSIYTLKLSPTGEASLQQEPGQPSDTRVEPRPFAHEPYEPIKGTTMPSEEELLDDRLGAIKQEMSSTQNVFYEVHQIFSSNVSFELGIDMLVGAASRDKHVRQYLLSRLK